MVHTRTWSIARPLHTYWRNERDTPLGVLSVGRTGRSRILVSFCLSSKIPNILSFFKSKNDLGEPPHILYDFNNCVGIAIQGCTCLKFFQRPHWHVKCVSIWFIQTAIVLGVRCKDNCKGWHCCSKWCVRCTRIVKKQHILVTKHPILWLISKVRHKYVGRGAESSEWISYLYTTTFLPLRLAIHAVGIAGNNFSLPLEFRSRLYLKWSGIQFRRYLKGSGVRSSRHFHKFVNFYVCLPNKNGFYCQTEERRHAIGQFKGGALLW